MTRMSGVACVVGLLLAIDGGLQADDGADARVVIDKAIRAMGGEERLAKFKANVSKGKGRFYNQGRAIEFTGQWFVQPPGQLKAMYVMEMGGKKMTRIEVIDGDKGWIFMGDKLQELPATQLAEIHEGMFADSERTLLALKNPAFQFTALGEAKIGNRQVVGIKVTCKGHKDVSLYFDKELGFVLKMQTRSKDVNGREIEEETYYNDYRDCGPIKSYTKLTTKRDGKDFLDWEATEYQAVEKLEKSVFDKPVP